MKHLSTKLQKTKLFTAAEINILDYYLRIAKDDRFCVSSRTTAEAVGLKVWDGRHDKNGVHLPDKNGNEDAGDNKTVRKANLKFKHLGILSWVSGNGFRKQANQYRLNMLNLVHLTE